MHSLMDYQTNISSDSRLKNVMKMIIKKKSASSFIYIQAIL